MTGWLVGCALPYDSLGRLSVPRRQLRYHDGFIRFVDSRDGKRLLCFLVDAENHLIYAKDQVEACLKSERLGLAVQHFLERYNHYQAGEETGVREQIMVGA